MSISLFAVILVCLVSSPVRDTNPKAKGLNLGFDYQAMLNEHMQQVAEGKADKAIESLMKRTMSADTFSEDFKVTLRKRMATIYGSAGTYLGHELVGHKRITSRIVRVYAVSHFDRFAITYSFLFLKGEDEQWKLAVYTLTDGVDELEKITPLSPIVVTP